MRITALLSLTLFFFTAEPAQAADNDPKAAMPPPQEQNRMEPEANPALEAVNQKAAALAKKLTADEAKTLGQIRENFGYLRSIGIALESVQSAVAQCGEKNPAMKEAISKRHEDWADKIGAAHTAQEKKLAAALDEKNFKEPEAVRDYLGAIDAMAEESEKKIGKQVVTTQEACKNLQESMNETEQVILKILGEMRWPGDTPEEKATNGEEVAP